ncbi:penicillin-binding protein [Lysobacter arseniciresistens ZS79]|uniref:Penicillin-binding protein 1B n=1 Tax=Lysobacter arseniciresistens ZS79 TaxID=913325 RepID=A0A0A0F0B5_9GAMM|nr:penicillin-binding protein 1B [Lysobacter arseniciresistens]KGM56626.1 penicillin-binding protein [Lysobacter arseniciresistens ZS79]
MARSDYETDDNRNSEGTAGHWRRRLVTWVLAAIGLGLGFLIPYSLYLNHEVGERFDQLRWQLPTRVYGRPLELAPGLALDKRTLTTELAAAGYHPGDGVRPGTYSNDGGRWLISSRGFNDVDGRVAPRRIAVTLSGGKVASVRDAGADRKLKVARLDPARIATLYGQKQEERRLVQLEEVPELLVTGLQAVEDRDFAHHHGLDLSGILRAAWVNLKAGEARQGASTLTQQLARSGLLGIGAEQTWTRKFNEAIYALLIEARYDKQTILETYFNQVYLGQRGAQAIHGVAAASEFWFGRDLADISTEQIALLIGIVRGPSYYDPRRHPERATERRNFVLGEMHETGLIDDAEYQRALKAPLGVTEQPGHSANRFPAYVDLIRRQLATDYPADALAGAGLSVMSGMSPSAQAYAEGAVTSTLESLASKNRPDLQAGLVLTDVHNGDVLAVVGSGSPSRPGFNRAIDALRPVGSLLKPFVYLLALAQPDRWSLASWVDDSPVTVALGNGKQWSPGNSDGRSHGTVRLIDALARSYNQATVRVGMQVDARRIADLIRTLAGIEAEPNPALILGSVDQSPYAMAQLYQFLASGGEIQPLHAVRGVLDANGRALNRYDTEPAPAQEGDAIAARLITLALQHTVSSGTARQLVADGLGRLNAAGKTGTSNDSRDSWFAGYTGDHLAVAWVGNDQNEPTGLYGSTGGMRVWSNMFKRLPSAPLEVSDKGLDWQWVVGSHATDAGCAGARRFAFVAGFAPAFQPCQPPEPVYEERRSWRDWFGFGRDDDEPEPAPEPTPAPQPVEVP